MERNSKFVQSMLESANRSHKIEPESKVDLSDVEKITAEIKKKLQRS